MKIITNAYLRHEVINLSPTETEYELRNPDDHYISPHVANDEILKQFPRTFLISTLIDPFLDQTIEFGKKLRKNGVEVDVEILRDIGHGFLHLAQVFIYKKKINSVI